MAETELSQITEHVYWMSPGKPDRPALAAVAGARYTLMLDAGASESHTRLFLHALSAEDVRPPQLVALTHWHWDHVFGAAELHVPVIASAATADQLAVLARYEWSDAALDQRVAEGTEIPMCAADIKVELPAPRTVRIVPPTIIFDSALQLDLGAVTVIILPVGGDHAADACVMYMPEDRVLFLGDCLY
jgi:glyoxylase-like metal-dependent hydrolase (beta-lactamase superfamily II)